VLPDDGADAAVARSKGCCEWRAVFLEWALRVLTCLIDTSFATAESPSRSPPLTSSAAKRSPMHRHQWRQAQVEKLRHALEQLVAWQKPVIALTAESTAMHAEVERMRGVLAYIARGGQGRRRRAP
jgi:hypothetical protein